MFGIFRSRKLARTITLALHRIVINCATAESVLEFLSKYIGFEELHGEVSILVCDNGVVWILSSR